MQARRAAANHGSRADEAGSSWKASARAAQNVPCSASRTTCRGEKDVRDAFTLWAGDATASRQRDRYRRFREPCRGGPTRDLRLLAHFLGVSWGAAVSVDLALLPRIRLTANLWMSWNGVGPCLHLFALLSGRPLVGHVAGRPCPLYRRPVVLRLTPSALDLWDESGSR